MRARGGGRVGGLWGRCVWVEGGGTSTGRGGRNNQEASSSYQSLLQMKIQIQIQTQIQTHIQANVGGRKNQPQHEEIQITDISSKKYTIYNYKHRSKKYSNRVGLVPARYRFTWCSGVRRNKRYQFREIQIQIQIQQIQIKLGWVSTCQIQIHRVFRCEKRRKT